MIVRNLGRAARAALWCAVSTLSTLSAVAHAAPQEVTYLLAAPPTTPAYAPWMIANEKGYYAQEGLRMRFVTARGGVDVAKQLGSGNALLGSAIGDTAVIVRANGVPVRTVALLGSGSLTHLVVRRDAGIKSVADLRGKAISVMAYGDTTYYALLGLLRTAGLGKDDVRIEAGGPSGVWQQYAAGQAPAMAAVPEWIVMAEKQGVASDFLPLKGDFYSMAQAIIASDDAIANHPEIVAKVVRATLRAQQDIIDDPRAAALVYAKAVPSFAGKEAQAEETFRLYIKYVYGDQKVRGWTAPERLAAVQRFYVQEGIVRQASALDALYTNRFAGLK
ncbi:ABC transporter substrate-binding protein [Chitinasiproducens palmae]|uniref:NitT/TauT family transport system substrate-binding protein n=1 Tax=Chitinasiproducens palmae TaxID=1770053 RepID=A0A1H2PIJ8_9BURK|nr:ABC transporter substrate-binding protein [Chitinasiproducens palmae]SDV46117.1 NitT/TauT family transport system substrate-binding protein [Chitinasiproducens palmae]